MAASPEEWFIQARYDMSTADFLLGGRRYIYALFMCHLSVEKALKGLLHRRLGKAPPKTHDLLHLADRLGLALRDELNTWMARLNEVCVAARYPDRLEKVKKGVTAAKTRQHLATGKEFLKWLRKQLSKP